MPIAERPDEDAADMELTIATQLNATAIDPQGHSATEDPGPSGIDGEREVSSPGLQRRVALYERTLGVAVLPVMLRRLAIALVRRVSAGLDRTPNDPDSTYPPDPRVWVDAGPHDTGRFRMFIDPSSVGHGARLMAHGTYDETFVDALRPHSALQGAVVWDVGAHIGYESLLFAELVGPAGRVVAFEPNPANAREWQRNVKANRELAKRMSLHATALCDKSGTAALRFREAVVGGGSSGSHLADAVPPDGKASYAAFGLVDVACARVDDLVDAGEIAPPTIIKIDVEGAEADVVRGAIRTLHQHKPSLLVEVHHVRAMHDLEVLLQEAGYVSSVLEASEETCSRCFLKAVPVDPEPPQARQ